MIGKPKAPQYCWATHKEIVGILTAISVVARRCADRLRARELDIKYKSSERRQIL